jgi:VWFA-related protein
MKSSRALPALLLCALAAQTPPPPAAGPAATPQNPQPQVLKVTTHLVLVNVVVHGKKNEPVTGLKKEDFAIFDDGQRQQVATFAIESSRQPAAGTKQAKLVLPPNTYTNRVDIRPTAPKAVTIMLLDGLNTRFEDQAYAKKQLIAYLKQLQPEDSVALYALGRNLQILHDFTSNAAVLIDAANKHKGRAATELADSETQDPDTGNDDLDAFISQADQRISDYQTINRVETTLAALEAVANHVAGLAGRKNLIWISGGFPFQIGMLDQIEPGDTRERRTFTEEMERAARAVSTANLAIYPVDARGLVAQPDLSANVRGSKNARTPPSGPSKAMERLYETQATMQMIADRTGGKAYYNSNDLKNAIRGAIEDAQVTYVLGYYPTHRTWDGKFHELKVQLPDRKGLNVRHRAGYNALPEVPQGKDDRVTALREAAWSALNATQVGLVARLGRDIPQPGKLRVVMSIDPHNISLEHKGDRWTGALDLLFVQQPAPDQPTSVLNDSLSLNLTETTYQAAMKSGLRFLKDLDLATAGYFLRVAVRDAASGNVGSVNIRTDRVKAEPPVAGEKK